MKIELFIINRINHDVKANIMDESVGKMLKDIVQWHENFPILTTTEPEVKIDLPDSLSDIMSHYTMSMTQQMAWLTTREYRKKFGDEPPTGPVLKIIAARWKYHAQYDVGWAL